MKDYWEGVQKKRETEQNSGRDEVKDNDRKMMLRENVYAKR